MKKKILVIKLGALGDFVQATGAFSSIRKAHAKDEISLLTTKGMLPFAKNNPHFDHVLVDERKKPWDFQYLKALRDHLCGYDMVYDLQTNDRTNLFYYWLSDSPYWCGIAPFCSHKQTNPKRSKMHTLDRLADQIAVAGIEPMDGPDLSYAAEDSSALLDKYRLDVKRLVLLVPGGSAHRPEKRWSHFVRMAKMFEKKGFQTALIGAGAEEPLLKEIETKCAAVNLCNQTSLGQLVDLSSKVKLVIGNDTGPTHIAAASGARGAVLFGSASNPDKCAPRAEGFHIFRKDEIDDITPEEVWAKLAGQ